MTTDLAFVEKCKPWLLQSRFFPSKVGGMPAWLELKNIPCRTDVECDYCREPCIFLCQVYAPYEDDPNAFHRTIYIFICRKAECCKTNQSGNLKVFRSQLRKINTYYPSDPPVECVNWRADIDVSYWTKTCYVCGILAPSHCAKCKCTNYCCIAHQVHDWKNGHKDTCATPGAVKNYNTLLFPELEFRREKVNFTEEANEQDDLESEEKEIEKYNTMIQSGKAGSFQHENVNNDLLLMANDEKDETFSNFRSKIDKYPDQVLRYNRGGQILYISSYNQVPKDVPKCPECNDDRQFEFQIMPQLLNFLGFKDVAASLDWGILAIFTCKRSCMPNDKYVKEYIWKQDIIQEKVEPVINQDI